MNTQTTISSTSIVPQQHKNTPQPHPKDTTLSRQSGPGQHHYIHNQDNLNL